MKITTGLCHLFIFADKKRKVYNQYGKDGLINGGSGNGGRRRNHQRHPGHYDPFGHDFVPGFFNFSFRDPEDVFREFFNTSDITDLLFPGKYNFFSLKLVDMFHNYFTPCLIIFAQVKGSMDMDIRKCQL